MKMFIWKESEKEMIHFKKKQQKNSLQLTINDLSTAWEVQPESSAVLNTAHFGL